MQVFLIRHASAVDETLAVRDPHRPLTAAGRAQATGLGDRMRWHDCLPTHVWTSPLVRAVQTTELVCAGLHATVTVDVVPALAPDGAVRDVAAAIHALPPTSAVMVVGHEPALSALGALLVGDPRFEALAKAQCARIIDGVVRWRFDGDGDAPVPPALRPE
ncbi:MAG: histidine phosphatase family protein [Deltaproteobacteria bacterium]|nr:histidine phosphatase family protein [Deltaproteobacteria bacterium]MCW5804776.1 histidine phosphatase family protein [Deltaproteobacteria bacterium]